MDRALASGAFGYSSIAGMLLYLSGHTHPDITFAVNCCACYMFCPKHLHELALKRIGCYLKQTPNQGMVMNPSSDVCTIDAYPDADFAGMYGHEEHTDPACTRVGLDSSSLLQIVLSFGNPSYRQRRLYR